MTLRTPFHSDKPRLPASPRSARLLALVLAATTLVAACSPDASTNASDSQGVVADSAAFTSGTAQADGAALERRARPRAMLEEAAPGKAAAAKLMSAPVPAPASIAAGAGMDTAQPASTAPSQRFLAVSHRMQIESPAAELAGLWETVKSTCERLDCYVEGSALQRETAQSAASAYLTMRINPRDFAMLTATLGGNAKILNHQTSTEDKTSQVIDVEAQIKNRSEYRDSLRELLREKNVKRTLQDLIEIRDTMSQVQAEIDAAATQRALLERETAKQLVQMQFQPQRVIVSGTYSPWRQTWQRSWDTFAFSAQSLVVTVAGLIPWLLVLVVIGVPLWLGLRRRFARRAAAAAAKSVASAPVPVE
ncbi:DUF4349 domain-containing protein [Comamonas testosteroni]